MSKYTNDLGIHKYFTLGTRKGDSIEIQFVNHDIVTQYWCLFDSEVVPIMKYKGNFIETTNVGNDCIYARRCIYRSSETKQFVKVKLKKAGNSAKFNKIKSEYTR